MGVWHDMGRKYTAFISYRHLPLDTAVAEKLHKKIERYRIPRELRKSPAQKRLGIVFRDRDELPLSNDLTQDIYDALDRSEFLIVVCTPDTPKSLWVTREIEHFLKSHDHNHILTVLAAGTPEESIPPGITHVYAQDGTVIDRREPLCALIAAEKPRKVLRNLCSEFQRLVAAILGKPLDAIRQRAKVYRWKLAGRFMALVAAVLLCFAGMLIFKNQQVRNQLLQTQLNESELLTLTSRNQLADGDRTGALESALRALPTPGNERPYYFFAGAALEDALYLYKWPSYRARALITESFKIHGINLSDDGKYAIGLTDSEQIICYDLSTQKHLWEHSWLDDSFADSVRFLEKQNAVLYTSCSGNQFVLNALTGETLFSCDLSSRTFPEDFTKNEQHVAFIDHDCAVFFDTKTGQSVRSETIDRGEPVWSACGGYSADETRFLMVYTGIFDGDQQLRCAIIDTQTGSILHNVCTYTDLSESIFDQRVIALEDGSFFVVFRYEGSRYYCRIGDEAQMLAIDSYQIAENSFAEDSLQGRIQLIDGIVCIVESDAVLSIDPKTCHRLAANTHLKHAVYCQLFADGSIVYKKDDQLLVYQLNEDGTFTVTSQYDFPWEFSTVYSSVCNSDVFLTQSTDDRNFMVVHKLGYLGTEAVNAEKLPVTLSGTLIYLPDQCGIYCSSDSETIYIQDHDGLGHYSKILYRVADGQTNAVESLDIQTYTGTLSYDGPIPAEIDQEINLSVVTKNRSLAAFATTNTLYLYDLKTNTLRSQIPNTTYGCDTITFLQDGHFVMIGSTGYYTVADTTTGEVVGRFETGYSPTGHGGLYTQIRESADGSLLFICSSVAEFAGAIVETENWTVLRHVDRLVGYLPATDTLVYVSSDYKTVYLQQRLKTMELVNLGKQALAD